MVLLSVEGLDVRYDAGGESVHAVDAVSFALDGQSIVGLLGESGCGKTTLARAIIQDLDENGSIHAGSIDFDGINVLGLSKKELRELRWNRIAFIPQDAMNILDPVFTIREQLVEIIDAHDSQNLQDPVERAREVLSVVNIDESRLRDYPHQLSGGMKQRVVLAMALVLEPDLIIADEPTTGLDVLTRDKILNDIERYRDEFGISILIVSHDIADLVETCDSLLVMYGGKIMERGPSRQLFAEPMHPYTIGLKNSLPDIKESEEEFVAMNLDPPDLRNPPPGCRFVDRCPYTEDRCHEAHPDFMKIDKAWESACYRSDEAELLRSTATEVSWNGK